MFIEQPLPSTPLRCIEATPLRKSPGAWMNADARTAINANPQARTQELTCEEFVTISD